MSREDAPSRTSNVPASTTQPPSQTANAWRSSVTATSRLSPGSSHTLANAFSSWATLYTVDSTSWTYTCTTSLPARSPVLVTVVETVTESPSVMKAAGDQVNVV